MPNIQQTNPLKHQTHTERVDNTQIFNASQQEQNGGWLQKIFLRRSASSDQNIHNGSPNDQQQHDSSKVLGFNATSPLPIQTVLSDTVPGSTFAGGRRGSPHMFPSLGMMLGCSPNTSSSCLGVNGGGFDDEFDTSEMIHFLNQGAK